MVDVVLIGRVHRALEPLHSMIYFAPEADREYVAIGLRPGRMGYFASRSAPMGTVGPGVVTATFYNFNPELIARHIPRAWSLADPEQILAARLRAADQALQRLLGADVLAGEQVAEAAKLARTAAAACRPDGRPLFAGHADLVWPVEPHLVLWHAISLLREHRGDGHVAALLQAQLSGLEAIVTHTATGRGFLLSAAKKLRGWSDEEWAAAEERLRLRGLLDDKGALTPAGVAQRSEIEQQTDTLDAEPWAALGEPGTSRLVELGKVLSRQAVSNGAFPAGVFATA